MKSEILEISDLSRGGKGVAKQEGEPVVFVPFTAPGDLVEVKIVKTEKKYAEAELVKILKPSPLRIPAPCPVFGQCGGCEWQHIPYEKQWQTKVEGVLHALKRVRVTDIPSLKKYPATQTYGYRNRVQLRGLGEKLGYFERKSHTIVDIEQCPIAQEEINLKIPEVRAEAQRRFTPDRQYKVEIEAHLSGASKKVREIWNAPHGVAGFRQINDEQNLKLVEWVAERITKERLLYDLYGGAGNLSLGLASQMTEVHCVDLGTPKVSPYPNYHFHRSAVLPFLKKTSVKNPSTTAIFDPPREGLGQDFAGIHREISRLNVDEVLFVGCDPDAFAREVARFLSKNWQLIEVAIFDFFPQNHHVESSALLRLANRAV